MTVSLCESMTLVSFVSNLFNFVFFFFQAEDGIRDRTVTGVQTCALPISIYRMVMTAPAARIARGTVRRASTRSEERRVGKSVDLGGCRNNKKKKKEYTKRLRVTRHKRIATARGMTNNQRKLTTTA